MEQLIYNVRVLLKPGPLLSCLVILAHLSREHSKMSFCDWSSSGFVVNFKTAPHVEPLYSSPLCRPVVNQIKVLKTFPEHFKQIFPVVPSRKIAQMFFTLLKKWPPKLIHVIENSIL